MAGNGTSTPDATYQYDGDGRRVKKITNSETTIFVYNASGQLVAEYSTALATTPQVSYLTTDHLGSPRVVTDKNGVVIDRKDYSAFGEESTSAQRSANTEYTAADQLRKNYTGYEKDSESGLEFAQARYYNPTHGRYTSVDPLTASASLRNPQTFNRYSYVLNSPYKFTDPLGLLPVGWADSTGYCGAENSSCDNTPNEWNEIVVTWEPEHEQTFEGHTRDQVPDSAHESGHQQAAAHPAPPPPIAEQNDEPQTSRVEPRSSDPGIVQQNDTLASIFTDGNGIVRTTRTDPETFFGDGPSHFRFPDGQIWAIHVYGDETGNTSGNVFVPKGFKVTYIGGHDGTVVAYNGKTGDLLYFHHIKGAGSQRELNQNMKRTNAAGSRLIGQTGGKEGNSPGYRHACIKLYNGYQGRSNYVKSISGRAPVNQGDYGDFRGLIH